MKHKAGAVAAILLSLAEPMASEAASFDCAKSTSKVEKLICEDQQLSYLDVKLNLIYRATSRKLSQANDLKHRQRKWLGERDSCQDIVCLQQSYSSRISELALSLDPVRNRNDENVACNTVADYANRGELSRLHVAIDKNALSIIQKHFNLSGVTGYWVVDLDEDGVPDPIVIGSAGTAHIASVAAKSSRYSNVAIGLENDFQKGELDLDLILLSGKYFVLTKNENKLVRLWHVAKGGFSPICEFKQRENPQTLIAIGADDPVCQNALSGKVNYISFSPMSYFLNDYDIIKGEVMADVTNTGQQSKVSLVNMLMPGGRGCSWLEIKVADEKNPENLISLINKSACNTKQDLFVLDGKIYIDERIMNSNWPRSVYMVRGKEISEICKFDSRPYFEVHLSE